MRKPKIKIVPHPEMRGHWLFLVKWPGQGWKNRSYFTFEAALYAVGVK